MRQTLYLLNALQEKEIKLTPKGKLPVKIVTALYELGSHSANSDIYEHKTEDRIFEVQFFRAVMKALGLIKDRSGKLSLTAKGKKFLSGNPNKVLQEIIEFFFTQYNTGWYDCRGNYDIGNVGRSTHYGFCTTLEKIGAPCVC